jgi:hypothetical protein
MRGYRIMRCSLMFYLTSGDINFEIWRVPACQDEMNPHWLLLLVIFLFSSELPFTRNKKKCSLFWLHSAERRPVVCQDIFLLVLIVFFSFSGSFRPILPIAQPADLFFTLVFLSLFNGTYCISYRWWTASLPHLGEYRESEILPAPLPIAQLPVYNKNGKVEFTGAHFPAILTITICKAIW